MQRCNPLRILSLFFLFLLFCIRLALSFHQKYLSSCEYNLALFRNIAMKIFGSSVSLILEWVGFDRCNFVTKPNLHVNEIKVANVCESTSNSHEINQFGKLLADLFEGRNLISLLFLAWNRLIVVLCSVPRTKSSPTMKSVIEHVLK